MITLELARYRDGSLCSQDSRQETQEAALSFLVNSELAFGAQVIELTPDFIRLETHLAGMIDCTAISGSTEEMRQLVELVAYYLQAASHENLVNGGAAHAFLDLTGGNPVNSGHILNLGAPIFVGRSRLGLAVMLALGHHQEEDLALAAGMSLGDLFAVIDLLRQTPGARFSSLAGELGFVPVT